MKKGNNTISGGRIVHVLTQIVPGDEDADINASTARHPIEIPDFFQGGEVGLQAMIAAARFEFDATTTMEALKRLLAEIESALASDVTHRQTFQRALKLELWEDCRLAAFILYNVRAHLPQTPEIAPTATRSLPFCSPWAQLMIFFIWMTSVCQCLTPEQFVCWLKNEIIPCLKFAISGEPVPNALIAFWAEGCNGIYLYPSDVAGRPSAEADGGQAEVEFECRLIVWER